MARDKRPHLTLLRSFALADFITLGNAACGTASIFFCLRYLADHAKNDLWAAMAVLPIALVLDVLDGSVARWRRKQSPLGADLDSLADVISFGVAPAVLGFTVGMRGAWDALLLIYFVACGISRLARFNVTAASLSGPSGKVRYYEGTPIPTSLAIVLLLAVAFANGAIGDGLWFGAIEFAGARLHPLVFVYALSGTLMASATLRIPKP